MSLRKILLAVTAIGSLTSLAVPAGADVTVGVHAQVAGQVVSATVTVPPALPTFVMSGKCAYVGVTTIDGKIQFVFGGETTSYSAVPTSIQSVATRATCTIVSPAQGLPGEMGTLTMSIDIRAAGPAAATPPGVTDAWPLRPVRICVSGDAHFGPIPAETTLPLACSDTAVTP